MNFRPQENGDYAQPQEEVFQDFRNRLAQATDELQRIVQKHEHAFKLSMITALPVTEAYRLVSLHGLGFTETVAELLQDGCSIAAQQDFSFSRFEAATQPKACRGCQHYYGHVDGMHRLICAMHPYGPETDDCEDWEAIAHHL